MSYKLGQPTVVPLGHSRSLTVVMIIALAGHLVYVPRVLVCTPRIHRVSTSTSLKTSLFPGTLDPTHPLVLPNVRKMIFSIKVFVTLLDYIKIPQVANLGDLRV
jgi:hypothetical protein